MCKGPFVTVRLAQFNFGGSKRPTAPVILSVMENLEKDGCGKVKKIGLSQVFFKKLPSSITDDELKLYEIDREKYRLAFNERAEKSVISKESFNRFLEQSPDKKDLKDVYGVVPED